MNAKIYYLFQKRVKREVKWCLSTYYAFDTILDVLTSLALFFFQFGTITTIYKCLKGLNNLTYK